jgi:carbonyl reductase 1
MMEADMRRILVTGANKGIGYAIAQAILEEHSDTYVILGARSAERGRRAAEALGEQRVRSLELDVVSDDSVSRAARVLAEDPPLYAVVNNAGVMTDDVRETLAVNLLGVRRVSEALLPLLQPDGGRIVNVTSAAGPNFVSQCSPERQKLFVDPQLEWTELQAFVELCLKLGNDAKAYEAKGLGNGNAYGLSKACANSYTRWLARQHPRLHINACTPGFIDTDLTRPYAQQQGKSPEELGMKPASAGARSTLHLLFAELKGHGHYYGSDAQRSPLDRYRSPGDPPYTGD